MRSYQKTRRNKNTRRNKKNRKSYKRGGALPAKPMKNKLNITKTNVEVGNSPPTFVPPRVPNMQPAPMTSPMIGMAA